MKTKKIILRWYLILLACVLLSILLYSATNYPVETGPHYGPWSCCQPAGAVSPGTLDRTNINVSVGQTVVPPVLVTSPVFTNGLQQRWVSYDLNTNLNHYEYGPVLYVTGPLYFSPPISNSYGSAGTYTSLAEVDGTSSSLVGWWPGEGNANDLVFTNNGTLKGGTTFGYGMVGRAFNFNGTGNYVEIAGSTNISPAGTFTVEAWVNYNGLTGNSGICIVAKGQDREGAMDWALNIGPNGALRPHIQNAGTWRILGCATVLNPGTWYHVAMVYDGAYVRGYVNGVQDGQMIVGPGQVAVSTNSMRIGAYAPVNGTASKCFFSGLIDEVSFYTCALSAAQIQAIYNAGSAGKCWNGSAGGCAALPAGCLCASPVSVTVGTVAINVSSVPVITVQPTNVTTTVSNTVTFTVVAAGTPSPSYQWVYNGVNLATATNATLVLSNVQTSQAGNYWVVVSNPGGIVTSAIAVLAVNAPPSITTQPQPVSQTVVQGANATFSLSATGTLPLSYQWYFNGANLIPRATTNTYTKLVVVPADAGNYDALVTNIAGSVTSSNASLTVIVPPIITQQPTNLTVNLTSNATFNVSVSSNSTPTFSYQWLWNGNALAGATNASLTIANVQNTNVGYYSVVVTNAAGTNISMEASLTVTMISPGLTNASAMRLNGDAVYTNTSDGRVLELTPATNNQAGSAFFMTPVVLASNASFSTFFSFRLSKGGGITDVDNITGADGIVFITQTLTNNVGGKGGGIGYLHVTNSVGVEFDTWYNNGIDADFYTYPTTDPQLPAGQTNSDGSTGDGNHIGINYNGFLTNTLSGLKTNNTQGPYVHITPAMNNGNIWYAWVDYNGATSNLEVRLSTNNIRPLAPTLANTVNLLDYLHTTNAYLGFTAGTGGSYNQQDILSWQFISPYHPIGLTNPAPTVVITSPSNYSIYVFGPPIALQATAVEPGGMITNVRFFSGTNLTVANLLGTAVVGANNTYDLAWTNSLHGTNTLTAVASDYAGFSTTSSVVFVTMDSPPTVTAASTNVIWLEGGTNMNVTLAGNVTDDGLPYGITHILWSVISSNGSVTFAPANVASPTATFATNGIYVLQLQADDGFATNNTACKVWIKRRPFIWFASPASNSVFGVSTPIVLNATAYDLDGILTGVQFFNGANLLGNAINVSSNSYAFTWTPASNGVATVMAVATDNDGLTNSATISIVLNQAPRVSAGPNQIITLPQTTVTLAGCATDDNLPPGAALTTAWSVVSSNGPVTFGNVYQTNTWAGFVNNGLYVLRLTAGDTASTNSATVTITVNQAPQISAGASQLVTLWGASVLANLSGSFTDDGLPVGAPVTAAWSVISATNGTVVIANTNLAATTATFTNSGNYILQLSVNDTVSASSSNITITVNRAPVVYAGADQTLIWNEGNTNISINLTGSSSDDGIPYGILTNLWSVSSGPGTVIFASASSTNTTATFSTNGTYVLQLLASDGAVAPISQCTVVIERRPFVFIVSPTSNSVFVSGTIISNQAVAYDLDGVVTNVQFFNGGSLIGTASEVLPLLPGCVGWWRAEGNANDSASTNNGVTQNVTYANGMAGSAFAFDPRKLSLGDVGGRADPRPAGLHPDQRADHRRLDPAARQWLFDFRPGRQSSGT